MKSLQRYVIMLKRNIINMELLSLVMVFLLLVNPILTACGGGEEEPNPPVTQSCRETNHTPEQIENSVIAAISAVADPWGNINDFELFLDMIEAELGCILRGELGVEAEQFSSRQTQGCTAPGVQYCGPGGEF